MMLELHQLELRYEKLRVRKPQVERRLLASLAEIGQQVPVVVVASEQAERFVLVDGYKRLRALRCLHYDTLRATCWDLKELEALVLDRLMRTSESMSALEQGWFLQELSLRFELSCEELGRRFARTGSWVSRRMALVGELPEAIQERVRQGQLPAHAAMKHLVPLARANRHDCERLAEAISGQGLSTRQIGMLYAAWRDGMPTTRERLLQVPLLFLKAREHVHEAPTDEARALLDDLDLLAGVARRAGRRLDHGVFARLLPTERQQAGHIFATAQDEIERLAQHLHHQEQLHAGSSPAPSHP